MYRNCGFCNFVRSVTQIDQKNEPLNGTCCVIVSVILIGKIPYYFYFKQQFFFIGYIFTVLQYVEIVLTHKKNTRVHRH